MNNDTVREHLATTIRWLRNLELHAALKRDVRYAMSESRPPMADLTAAEKALHGRSGLTRQDFAAQPEIDPRGDICDDCFDEFPPEALVVTSTGQIICRDCFHNHH